MFKLCLNYNINRIKSIYSLLAYRKNALTVICSLRFAVEQTEGYRSQTDKDFYKTVKCPTKQNISGEPKARIEAYPLSYIFYIIENQNPGNASVAE